MSGFWTGAGGAIIGGASGLFGMFGQRAREQRQHNRQKELMGIQYGNQQGLNQQQYEHQRMLDKYGSELQLQMWKDTNYPAQMAQLKAAGLNPALLYGMGGAGGATTGSQGGGSAQGGSASSGQAPMSPYMDMSQIIQGAMAQSQIQLNKAQAKKLDAEATNLGADTGLKEAQTLNTKVQTEINKLGLEIGHATKQDQIDEVTYRVESIIKNNNLTDEEAKKVKEQTLAIGIDNNLKESQTKLNDEERKAIATRLIIEAEKVNAMLAGVQVQGEANKLRAMEGKTDLMNLRNNFIIAVMQNEVAWGRLNIEQQKVFAQWAGTITQLKGSSGESTTYGNDGKVQKTEWNKN